MGLFILLPTGNIYLPRRFQNVQVLEHTTLHSSRDLDSENHEFALHQSSFQCLENGEDMSLDCVLLLMDTVNKSSQVRMISYRMYRTPVQYSIHYICNVNNTPVFGFVTLLLINTLIEIII